MSKNKNKKKKFMDGTSGEKNAIAIHVGSVEIHFQRFDDVLCHHGYKIWF